MTKDGVRDFIAAEYTLSENYVHGLAAFGPRLKKFRKPAFLPELNPRASCRKFCEVPFKRSQGQPDDRREVCRLDRGRGRHVSLRLRPVPVFRPQGALLMRSALFCRRYFPAREAHRTCYAPRLPVVSASLLGTEPRFLARLSLWTISSSQYICVS